MAGFSEDGRFYLYLESSRDTGAGIPKSRLQVIDIAANRCVSDGCLETNYGEGDADRTLEEAENSLLQKTSAIRQTLQITSPKLGSSVVMEGQSRLADGTETVTLRMNNRTIPVQLKQQRQRSVSFGGTAERDQAAMQLEVQVANQKKMVDSLENYREWVLDYSIRDAYLSPDGKYVVLLITATKPTFEGTLATTLVQGFEL
jgi:predicted secreted protein